MRNKAKGLLKINKHAGYSHAAFIARGLKINPGQNNISRWQLRHRHFFELLREKINEGDKSSGSNAAAKT